MSVMAPLWENAFRVIDPQIDTEGTHDYPFSPYLPVDVRFFTLTGRDGIRLNRHRYFEIYYVISGETTLQVQDRLFAVGENDLVVIGSDLYHRTVDPPDNHWRNVVLFFDPEVIRANGGTKEEMQYLMPFLVQKEDFPHVVRGSTGVPREVLDLMHRIHAELPATTAQARLAVRTYLKMILMLLVKHYAAYIGTQEDINRKHADLDRLRPLFDSLEKNVESPMSVNQAARLCAMSKSHFMYFFKRTTGQSFRSYLTHFRIAKAQDLLASTDEPISSISQAVAFCNQSYFGMMFRKLVGATPLAFRRRFGNGGYVARCAGWPHSLALSGLGGSSRRLTAAQRAPFDKIPGKGGALTGCRVALVVQAPEENEDPELVRDVGRRAQSFRSSEITMRTRRP